MNRTFLSLFLVVAWVAACAAQTSTYFKLMPGGQLMDSVSFARQLAGISAQLPPNAALTPVFGDTVRRGDSLITEVAYDVKVDGKVAKVTTSVMGDQPPANSSGRAISGLPADGVEGLLGEPLPAVSLPLLGGESLETHALRGRPTLLSFWFTKCAPCIAEIPTLDSLREVFGDRVNFVAVTFDEADIVQAFLADHDFSFEHVVDARSYIQTLGVTQYPRNLFLDTYGVVRYVERGVPVDVPASAGASVPAPGEAFAERLQALLAE